MDVLSDILDLLQLRGSLYFRTAFSPPWSVAVPALGRAARFHLAVQGRCSVRIGTEREVQLNPGDLIVIPGGSAHVLSDGSGGATGHPGGRAAAKRFRRRGRSGLRRHAAARRRHQAGLRPLHLRRGGRPPAAARPAEPPAGDGRAARPLALAGRADAPHRRADVCRGAGHEGLGDPPVRGAVHRGHPQLRRPGRGPAQGRGGGQRPAHRPRAHPDAPALRAGLDPGSHRPRGRHVAQPLSPSSSRA